MKTGDTFELRRMTFGRLLRHFRVRQMLSVRELAKRAGIANSHVSMLEHDQRNPWFKALRGLCSALELEGEELALLCDAALRQAPPDMKDRPASDSGLDAVLGPETDGRKRGFLNLNLNPPSISEEMFLDEAVSQTSGPSEAYTRAHSCSQPLTPSPKCPQAAVACGNRGQWKLPVRERAGKVRKTRRGNGPRTRSRHDTN